MLEYSLAVNLGMLLRGPGYDYVIIYRNLDSKNYILELASIYQGHRIIQSRTKLG